MKKIPALLLALTMCLGLSACGHFVSIMPGDGGQGNGPAAVVQTEAPADGFREQDLMSFLRWDDFAASYYDDTPVALSVRTQAGGYASPVFDRASIIAACDALRSMTVTDRVGDTAEDSQPDTVFTFTMADGIQYGVSFSGGQLMLSTGLYSVTGGDALWTIAFPGYGGDFDLFDLYFNEDIRAFADSFYENTPMSVGRRSNGGATLTSQDPAVVSQVFQMLANAAVARVEESPDQNIDLTQTTDYIFTMSDSTYYTFSFAGPCLAVTASDDYGPVYYWLNGLDDLPYVSILPAVTVPTFAGGPITGMREEIAQAQAAANGQLPDISVVGVYVDYNINGQHGYLTLDGATAISFVQQVTGITADAAAVEPGGEEITVFVTLSDQSGPIIVFSGDTVQQMVGINHACDPNAMANLRNTIQTLAQDSGNVSLGTESTTG